MKLPQLRANGGACLNASSAMAILLVSSISKGTEKMWSEMFVTLIDSCSLGSPRP
jgi:hypothetical protein